MLIGFQLDLTELAYPWRGTASSQGEGVCMGVSRKKRGGDIAEKGKGMGRGRIEELLVEGEAQEVCGRYC